MPEVTARSPIGAAIQAAKEVVKENRRTDTGEVTTPQQEVTKPQVDAREQAFIRRERAIRNQQREFQLQKQQWESQKAPVQPGPSREQLLNEIRERIAVDPMAAVSEFGLELQSLRDSQTSAQKLLEQQKLASEQFADNQMRQNIKMLIQGDAAYEAIQAMNAEDAVLELVKVSISEGDELSIKDAAQQVEDYLMEEALKAAAIPKIKARLTPQEVAELQATDAQQSQHTTLNQGIPRSQGKPTSKDRYERAIMRAKGLDPDTGKPLG